jgi:DNA adenine methylase
MSLFCLDTRMRPVLKWAGGKSQLLPHLIKFFPDKFERFIEPFVGAGSVFLSLSADIPCVINDANPELINMYCVIRDSPEALMKALDYYTARYCKEFYYELRAQPQSDIVLKAARTIFLNKTGFNGLYRQNLSGKFNVPWGKRTQCPELYEKKNILGVSALLKRTEILNKDFESILNDCKQGDFIYCDPPYEPISQTSFHAYKAGGFSREHQVRLKEACHHAAEKGATVAISNSSSPFIMDLYKQENIKLLKAKRSINSKGEGRGEIDEIFIIINKTFSPR